MRQINIFYNYIVKSLSCDQLISEENVDEDNY